MAVIVIEMPLLAKGITCAYCGRPIHDDYVYSVDGHNYRCQRCAKVLIDSIKKIRSGNYEVCKEGL